MTITVLPSSLHAFTIHNMPPSLASFATSVTYMLRAKRKTKGMKDQLQTFRTNVAPQANQGVVPLPKALTDRIPQELVEQFIDNLFDDKLSLLRCSIVCHAWSHASRHHLSRLLLVHPLEIDSGQPGNIVCALAFRRQKAVFYATNERMFYLDLSAGHKPEPVLSIPYIVQIDVLEDYNIVVILSAGRVLTIPLDELIRPGIKDINSCSLISNNVTFFKIGVLLERTFVCIVKSKSKVSSTVFKLMVPKNSYTRGPNSSPTLQLDRELYISEATVSVHFLRTRLVAGTSRHGFEVIDIMSFETHALLHPLGPIPDPKKMTTCLAVYRLRYEFLVCYDGCAFYIDAQGRMSRNDLIEWRSQPMVAFAYREPYLLAFSRSHIELRDADSGVLLQTIWIKNAPLSTSPGLPLIQTRDGRFIGLLFPS